MAEIRELKAKVRRLEEDNEILRRASIFSRGTRPPQPLIVAFVDEMRSEGHAVESTCRVLRGITTAGMPSFVALAAGITAALLEQGFDVAEVRPAARSSHVHAGKSDTLLQQCCGDAGAVGGGPLDRSQDAARTSTGDPPDRAGVTGFRSRERCSVDQGAGASAHDAVGVGAD